MVDSRYLKRVKLMQITELIEYYGSSGEVARAVEVSKQAVSKWTVQGFIPFNTQYRIEVLTDGKLKADRNKNIA